jgi:sec-independent protein translocase protein TatA
MAGLGWQELVIVLVIVVIIFGAGKLPEIGGAMGKSIKQFKDATVEDELPEGKSKTQQATASQTTVAEPVKPVESKQMRADEI